MENIIKETTEKLKNGTINTDEANKILLDLFGVMQRSEQLSIKKFKEIAYSMRKDEGLLRCIAKEALILIDNCA